MIVYLDILLTINFLINLLLIFVGGWILLQPPRWKRYLLAALAGTGIYFIFFVYSQYIFIEWICRLGGVVAMAWIAYAPRLKSLFARSLTLLIVGQLTGGVIYSFIFSVSGTVLGNAKLDNVSVFWVLAGSIVILCSAGLISAVAQRFKKQVSYLGVVSIALDGRRVEAKALLDSGNTLRHPVNGWPVILCEQNVIAQLAKDLAVWAEDFTRPPPPPVATRVALFPYKSVGGTGMLPGFRPDSITIAAAGQRIMLTQVFVAIRSKAEKSLSYPVIAFPIHSLEEGDIK